MTSPVHRENESGNYVDYRSTPFERHLQTGIGAILVGLVLWVGTTVNATTTQMAVLEHRVTQLTSLVEKLQQQISDSVGDRYRASDARRDFSIRDARMERHEERLNILEKEQMGNGRKDRG